LSERPRKFPCTEFVVRRDRYDGGVVDIQCHGYVLEPEIVIPFCEKQDFITSQDGDRIVTRSFDELKALLRSAGTAEQCGS